MVVQQASRTTRTIGSESQLHCTVSSNKLQFLCVFTVNILGCWTICKVVKLNHPSQQVSIKAPGGAIYIFPCDCNLKKGALSKELFPVGQEPSQIPEGRTYIREIIKCKHS